MAKKAQYRRGIPLFLALVLLLHTIAAAGWEGEKAVDPVSQPDSFSAVLYDNTNGLPTAEANAIVQTAEGFLWIGSYSGLIRYDGNTFERMDSTSGLASVVSLFVDSRNRLWIGTNDSGLGLMEQGEVRMWSKGDGLPAASVRAIAEDLAGTIYVATTAGVAILDQNLNLKVLDDARISGAYIHDLRLGSDGLIYGMTQEGGIFTLKDGTVDFFLGADQISVKGIIGFLPDPANPGCLYLGTDSTNVYYGSLANNLDAPAVLSVDPLSYVERLEYIDGQIWVCAGNGIGVLDNGGFHQIENLPMTSSVSRMMIDYQGNLWFVSTRQGVMKIVANQFYDLYKRFDMPKAVVNSTCLLDGMLFIATDTGLTVVDENGPLDSLPLMEAVTASGEDMGAYDLIELLDGCRIRSLIRDSQDRLWIATWRKFGLICYDHGTVRAFTEAEGMFSNRVRVVCEDRDGRIMVANTGGVCIIEGDRITKRYGEESGIVNTEILTVVQAKNGDLVLGSDGGGIYVIGQNGTRNISVEDGLPSDIVMRLKVDPDRDVIWIVTSNAIAYMTSDYQVTTVQKFPYSNNFDLFENSKGDMWVLSSNGIYVTTAEEMLANGEITPVFYGIASGLACITTANSYSELTPEGDLYIAGSTGVCKVNIEEPFEDVEDMKATVPFVEVDGRSLYPDGDGTFTIPSNTQKLTVHGFVFNYSLSDPQVSYWLDGFERTGTTSKRSEMVPVDYTNLRGGTYHFVMQLKDSMGRGNKEVSVQIVKEKAFYEQLWFYILVGLAVLLVIYLLVRMYVRRRMNALEAKHREEAERERVENEMKMATRIQTDALPPVAPEFENHPELNLRASMHTAKEVGGDFYDYFPIDENRVCFLIADVSGKGTPAALFMMTAKTMIKDYALTKGSTSEIFTTVNARLCENNEAGMFATAWIGILDTRTMTLQYTNAGHNFPLIQRKGQPCEEIKKVHGLILAGMDFTKYKQSEIQLAPGDRLLLYTDGVTEAHDQENTLYGTERLMEVLENTREDQGQRVLERIFEDVNRFAAGRPQFDDITMVVVTIKE